MKRLLLHSFGFILIVATICYVYAFIMAEIYGAEIYEMMNINQKQILLGNYQATFYVFDLQGYIKNLGEDANIIFLINVPNFPTMWKPTSWDITVVVKVLYNIIIWLINMFIWLLNILIVLPIKILIQPFLFIATIFGVNTNKVGMYQAFAYLYGLNIGTLNYWA